MPYPLDIQRCMRDCILSLIWPRKELLTFFRQHGCTTQDLRSITLDRQPEPTRFQIVDGAFDALNKRTDEGIGVFRSMMKSLLDWSYFDPYYFETLGKLNRRKAEGCDRVS